MSLVITERLLTSETIMCLSHIKIVLLIWKFSLRQDIKFCTLIRFIASLQTCILNKIIINILRFNETFLNDGPFIINQRCQILRLSKCLLKLGFWTFELGYILKLQNIFRTFCENNSYSRIENMNPLQKNKWAYPRHDSSGRCMVVSRLVA